MRLRGFEPINEDQFIKDVGGITDYGCFYGNIKLPQRATQRSAGYDLFALLDFTLPPNGEMKIPTGIKMYCQPNEVLIILPRSSLGFKYFTRLANTAGVIDSDYYENPDNDGHIWVKVRNEGDKTLHIEKGMAFAQALFFPYLIADGDNYEEGATRNGGLGSTSK